MQRETLAISRIDPLAADEPPLQADLDKIKACKHALQKGRSLITGRETRDQHIAVLTLEVLMDTVVEVLVKKGICTSKEFYKEVARQAQQEVTAITDQVGAPIDDEPDTGVVL